MAFYLKESHTYTHKRPYGLTYGYFPNVVAFYLKESHTFSHIYTHKTLWDDIWLLSKNVVAFYLKESHTYTHKRPCGLTCGYFPNVVAFYLKESHTFKDIYTHKTLWADIWLLSKKCGGILSERIPHIYSQKTLWADMWILSKCGGILSEGCTHTQEFLGLPKTGGTDKQMLMASVWSCSCARSLAGS